MREIKFRAWDKRERRMLYQEDTDYPFSWTFDPHGISVSEADGLDWEMLDTDIMEYTGLKDKNGREIYEGDIVAYCTEDGVWCGEVCWSNDLLEDYEYSSALRSGFELRSCRLLREYAEDEDGFSYEVIGNIHDNPELLEVER